eukprot:4885912-Pyramimonas_sp.AAC.1
MHSQPVGFVPHPATNTDTNTLEESLRRNYFDETRSRNSKDFLMWPNISVPPKGTFRHDPMVKEPALRSTSAGICNKDN